MTAISLTAPAREIRREIARLARESAGAGNPDCHLGVGLRNLRNLQCHLLCVIKC